MQLRSFAFVIAVAACSKTQNKPTEPAKPAALPRERPTASPPTTAPVAKGEQPKISFDVPVT